MIRAKMILFAMLLTYSASVLARGGDLVNNGGGLAEKNILFAYEKLEKFIHICLQSEVCKITASQKQILQKIYDGLPREKKHSQLEFASEKNLPGYFMIDGRIRVAATGSTVGSVIRINSDMLYTKNDAGYYEPLSMAEGVAILIHELGHHYGKYTHEELDLLGVRVSMVVQQKIISTPMIPWTSEISAQVFNPDMSSYPDVLLSVGDDVIDISQQYAAAVSCVVFKVPIPILPIPDIELVTSTPVGSLLHNVHWDKVKDAADMITVRIIGNISNKCAARGQGPVRLNNSKLSIVFTINKKDGHLIFDPASLVVNQFKDPWWKFIKLPM